MNHLDLQFWQNLSEIAGVVSKFAHNLKGESLHEIVLKPDLFQEFPEFEAGLNLLKLTRSSLSGLFCRQEKSAAFKPGTAN